MDDSRQPVTAYAHPHRPQVLLTYHPHILAGLVHDDFHSMTRYKKTVRYELRGSLTMERYRDIMADVEARKLPLPVEIVSTSNGGPNGSPNYTFTIKP